jgi:hypothetical protein
VLVQRPRCWRVAADSAYGDQDGFRSELAEADLPFVMALKPRRRTWAYGAGARTLVGRSWPSMSPITTDGGLISATDRGIIQAWNITTGGPVGEPFPGSAGRVTSLAALQAPGRPGKPAGTWPAILAGAGSQVTVLGFSPVPGASSWQMIAVHQFPSRVLAVAWNPPATFIAGTERGIVAIEVSWP